MIFEKHGKLEFTIRNKHILVVHGLGPWNKEVFTSVSDSQLSLIESLHGTNWAVLAIIKGEAIHTPEAGKLLTEMVIADKLVGRIATAVIVKDCMSPSFTQEHIIPIYESAGELVKCFDDDEVAVNWLTDQLNKLA